MAAIATLTSSPAVASIGASSTHSGLTSISTIRAPASIRCAVATVSAIQAIGASYAISAILTIRGTASSIQTILAFAGSKLRREHGLSRR